MNATSLNSNLPNPVAFPLLPIAADGTCTCAKGAACSRPGKHPAVKWKEVQEGSAVPLPAKGAGYGIKTGARPNGSGIVVVDLDNEDAVRAFEALGGTSQATYTVRTARGLHLYFAHPGFYVSNSASTLGKGIDIRGDGGFVVGPGSPHRSGTPYELDDDVPPAPLPEWLATWFKSRPAATFSGDTTCDLDFVKPEALSSDYDDEIADVAAACLVDCGETGRRHELSKVLAGALCAAEPSTLHPLRGIKHEEVPAFVVRVCEEAGFGDLEQKWTNAVRTVAMKRSNGAVKGYPTLRAEFPNTAHALNPNGTTCEADANVAAQLGGTGAPANDAAPSTAPKTFATVGWSDLAKPLPPVSYVIRHFGIAPGRPSILAGYGGLGKTIVAQVLEMHIASNEAECWGLPIANGRVVHFDYEMTLAPLQRRYQRLAVGHELQPSNLVVSSMPGIYLSDAEAESALCRAVDGCTLAVVDNLAAATATAQLGENESGIRRYLDKLTRVTNLTGCTFLVLAHERKGGKGDSDTPGIQRVRGSSAITDAAGSVVSIEVARGTGILTLSQNKASLRRQGGDLCLKIEDVGLSGADDESEGLRVVVADPAQKTAEQEAKAERTERATVDRLKAAMLEHLREKAKGMAQADLLDIVRGNGPLKKKALAELKSEERVRETKEYGDRRAFIRLESPEERQRREQLFKEYTAPPSERREKPFARWENKGEN